MVVYIPFKFQDKNRDHVYRWLTRNWKKKNCFKEILSFNSLPQSSYSKLCIGQKDCSKILCKMTTFFEYVWLNISCALKKWGWWDVPGKTITIKSSATFRAMAPCLTPPSELWLLQTLHPSYFCHDLSCWSPTYFSYPMSFPWNCLLQLYFVLFNFSFSYTFHKYLHFSPYSKVWLAGKLQKKQKQPFLTPQF